MALLLTCNRGHQWTPVGELTSSPQCPVCGLSTTLVQEAPVEAQPKTQAEGPGQTVAFVGQVEALAVTTLTAPSDAIASVPGVAGYELLGELGRGGMGVVYKARQRRLNRLVALKMILAGARAGAQELARFRAEAEVVAQLQHPNIVQIYEVGEQEGCPFFSLEYVDGGSLAQKLRGNPQPPRLATHFIMTLARAVHAAHQRRIVHRDLKPVNILLAAVAEGASGPDTLHAEAGAAAQCYGIPKIADFGLAKHLGENMVQTQSGSILGTPSYMSPEQAEGRIHAIGPATDVYALGTILYEMLTGRPPFRAETAVETIQLVVGHDPVKPTRLQPKVPHDLETICLKCLEKEATKRYASAEALAEDLRRFLEGQPILARPIGYWGRGVKWARRRPAWAALVGVSLLGTAALLAGSIHYHLQLRQAVQVAEKQREEARRNLVRLHVANGMGLMDAGDAPAALAWFTEALRLDEAAGREQDMDRQRIACVLQRCPRLAQVWAHGAAVNQARFSPDGTRVAAAADDGRVWVWDLASGKASGPPLEHAGAVTHAVFSDDGRRLVTAGRGGVARVWDPLTGKPVTPPLKHGAALTILALRPDGRQVVTAGGDETVRLWDAATGKRLAALKHPARVRAVAFSPDGRRLATACADGEARVWDTDSGNILPLHVHHEGGVRAVAFSPDGRRLATAGDDHTARVWDGATGAPVTPPLRHRRNVGAVVFSPDGGRVATADDGDAARIWNAVTGEPVTEALRHRSAIAHVAFSPDGCRLVTASDDNTARVWEAGSGRPRTPPLRHNGTVNHAAFSPDGRFVVTASDDGTARVWDLAGLYAAGGRRLGEALLPARSPLPGVRHRPGAAEGRSEGATGRTSPDGRLAVKIAADGTARVYDAHTGEARTPPLRHKGTVNHAAFSPDSRWVVTVSEDQTARVWDAATGQPRTGPLVHASGVKYAEFSPHGRRVVTTSDDNSARLWDAATGELLAPPLRHSGTVLHASFSPDGRLVATASKDQTARVWDAVTGEALTPPLEHPWVVHRADFSADGQRVRTSGPEGSAREWALSADRRSTTDLLALAQLLSGTRIDERRGSMPVEAPELCKLWQELRARSPEASTSPPREVLAWHETAAEECLRCRRWAAAVRHLDHLLTVEPKDSRLRARRGLAWAEQGRWTEAAADVAQAVADGTKDSEAWCLHALLRLQVGDAAGYRQACAQLLDFARSRGPDDAYLCAWATALAPAAMADAAAVVRQAERALEASPRSPDRLAVLGAVLCRAGRTEEAVRRLTDALARRGTAPAASEWLLLAIAEHRLGHTVEARRWLDRATGWLDQSKPQGDHAADSLSWAQRLQVEMLRREAERLLRTNGKSRPAG